MKSAGRYEIQSAVVTGAVDTYTARDPASGGTVLLHVLPAGHESNPRASFLEFASGCPGKILDSGLDAPSQRAYVVTEYPKDRKALLLWIKSLSTIAAKPKPNPPPKAALPPPPVPGADDGATRMFDPAAIYGGAPANAVKTAPQPAVAVVKAIAAAHGQSNDGGTRMFDPAAVFGTSAPPQSSPPPSAPEAGGTRMFDPAAVFGDAGPSPVANPDAPAPPPKTPPPPAREVRPRTDPFADLKAALARSNAASQSSISSPADATAKKGGEFTRRFQISNEFRGAPTKRDHTTRAPAVKKSEATAAEETDPKGVLTLMMEAYAKRVDGDVAPPAGAPGASEGATRMLDAGAIFGDVPPAPSAPPSSPQGTQRIPAMRPEEEKK